MQDRSNILDRPPPRADVRIRYGPHPSQFGDLRRPDGTGPHPLAVVVHGGFWRVAYSLDHVGHLCEALRGAGIATWSVEYRRIGEPGGGWTGTFDDVAAGANFAATLAGPQDLDTGHAVAVGHSAGGQLALWLAARQPKLAGMARSNPAALDIRGVVSLAGVADLRRAWDLGLSRSVVAELLGGSPVEVPERYRLASPIERVPIGVPQILLHGTEDSIVPAEIGRRHAERALGAGDDARFVPIEGAGHFELIDPRSGAWPEVEKAVTALARR